MLSTFIKRHIKKKIVFGVGKSRVSVFPYGKDHYVRISFSNDVSNYKVPITVYITFQKVESWNEQKLQSV